MKYSINETYPDETHYTIAVLSDEEEDLLKNFLNQNTAEHVETNEVIAEKTNLLPCKVCNHLKPDDYEFMCHDCFVKWRDLFVKKEEIKSKIYALFYGLWCDGKGGTDTRTPLRKQLSKALRRTHKTSTGEKQEEIERIITEILLLELLGEKEDD